MRSPSPGSTESSSLPTLAIGRRLRNEWPTWCLIVAIHGGWLLAASGHDALGTPLSLACLGLLACWYMSLQHELLHGHPTRWKAFNRLLGLLPLAVWYPYDLYREGHLAHH